jgi:radical SAM enzyme (TIGR01210 family)
VQGNQSYKSTIETAPALSAGFYPTTARARDRFVLDARGGRPLHDPWRHQGLVVEDEPSAEGNVVAIATVFLTGRECPWRCVMCDLWRHTTTADTPPGAIPAQISAARQELGVRGVTATHVKLYNAGSFFDPHAVPERDYPAVAESLHGLTRVVVESHPSLVGRRVDRLLDALDRHRSPGGRPVQLEVAMGLETGHPDALGLLNKRMTVDDFRAAAEALARRSVALRVFLLIWPPFVPFDEQDDWLVRSLDLAFSCGASVASLVPTRAGNGAVELPAENGCFRAPRLEDIERSIERAHEACSGRGRILVDLWDLERFADCRPCFAARRARLHAMNLEQRIRPPVPCAHCRRGSKA